jgi:nitroreductase/SAM-dependent methyltransferase
MSINGTNLLQFTQSRRSTRLFQDTPVDQQTLLRIIESAIQAPTACNRQLWHFAIITDPSLKQEIAKASRAEQSYLHKAPVLIAPFYDISLESHNPCSTAQVSMGMALYGILLAAHAEGLGAIYLGGVRNPDGIADVLHVKEGFKSFGIICIGHAAEAAPCPPRRPVEEVISFNQEPLPAKRFHHDIRPHRWTARHLADFREKLTWYKGIEFDAETLHVNPHSRASVEQRELSGRLGMLIEQYSPATVLDILPANGDLPFQALNTSGQHIDTLYTYELSPGTANFLTERLAPITDLSKIKPVVSPNLDQIHIALPDNHVDVISCYERLDHFEDPIPLLHEMHRVLSLSGTLLLSFSNRLYPDLYRFKRMRKQYYALGRNWSRGPERRFSPMQISALLKQTGFTVDSFIGIHPLEQTVTSKTAQLLRSAGQHTLSNQLTELTRDLTISSSVTAATAASIICIARRNDHD